MHMSEFDCTKVFSKIIVNPSSLNLNKFILSVRKKGKHIEVPDFFISVRVCACCQAVRVWSLSHTGVKLMVNFGGKYIYIWDTPTST